MLLNYLNYSDIVYSEDMTYVHHFNTLSWSKLFYLSQNDESKSI